MRKKKITAPPKKYRKGTAGPKRRLWKLFSEYIRRNSGNTCFTCGALKHWKDLDAGHYIPKSVGGLALYFDERNVHAQCTYCNRFMHGNLSKYALALQKKYGEKILEELDQKRGMITKNYPFDEEIKRYKEILASYES